jgi:hypothetical protein
MTKLPYGGFSPAEHDRIQGIISLYGENKPGLTTWQRLDEIANALEGAERLKDGRLVLDLSSELAAWLGIAILESKHNQQKLLLRLGLSNKQGRPGKGFNDWWVEFAIRIIEIERADGIPTNKAVGKFIEELQEHFEIEVDHKDMPSVDTLKRYRNKYYKLMYSEP